MALDFSTYPPKGHQERIAAYLRFEKLFLGQHKELYLTSPGRYQMVRYIVANFAGLISWLSARPGRSRWAHTTQLWGQWTRPRRPGSPHPYHRLTAERGPTPWRAILGQALRERIYTTVRAVAAPWEPSELPGQRGC